MTSSTTKNRPSSRVRIKREHHRGSYSADDRNRILDSTFLCHVGYCVDEQPFVIPTSHWREGDTLYWHGSSKSSMIKALSTGEREACVTVSHLDGLVLARSGFNTSVNYRSAICMGRPELITDKDEVIRQFELFFNRLAPGRWDALRPMADQELKATGMLKMDIVDFAVKERAGGPSDSVEADHDIWAGHIPITTEIGTEVTATDSKRADLHHEVMNYSF